MKGLSISGPESGSGKTLTSMIITRALKNQRLDISAIKCGPDYIDSVLLSKAGGKDRVNLDYHLQGREGMKTALSLVDSEYCLLEGAMGYFDGIGVGYQGSCYDISKGLDIDTILVYQQRGEMFTMVPKIQGMVDFSKGRIKAIILSNTTEKMYNIVKDMVKDQLNIPVLGYIEKNPDLAKLDASLDLELVASQEEFDEILDQASKRAMETIDFKSLVRLFSLVEDVEEGSIEKSGLSLAIAKDQCFSYLYGENDKLLNKYFNVKYFSPLKDKKLPTCDLLYIGGGYPENYLDQLSSNFSLIRDIRNYFEKGGHIYGEAGGMVYLSKSFLGRDMVGILDGKALMNKRLQHFGYCNVKIEEDCLLGSKGTIYPGHEYHRTSIESNLPKVLTVKKVGRDEFWKDGYHIKNAFLTYQYINFAGNQDLIENIIDYIKE